ncbi:unnamed protein product [Miscanthus lutarioriparius]|uniref:Uncharacterized protein n=1 Tax=Miscanthus lutarioriparius TaxID=422564 RepID=A0A811PYQ0_9POAL|nr:unnamed protein product [Miscanthus lutarioriparius]
MVDRRSRAVLIGVTAGVAAALLVAGGVLLAIWLYRRWASVAARTRSLESPSATLRADGCTSLDSSVSVSVVSESVADWGHPPPPKRAAFCAWRGGGTGHNGREPSPLSVSGIPKYHYKYVLHFVYSIDIWNTEPSPQSYLS